MSNKNNAIKLSAKWQLDAALLSRPVDLTALVSMSRGTPDKFLEDGTLHRLVTLLLNEKNKTKSDKDTKLDVINILANVAAGSKAAVAEVRTALGGVSEWFDDYMSNEEEEVGDDPELHKAMVLLLARCWEYRLKTEDVLELCQGNRRTALLTVVGLLEDGETYSTELKQRQRPGQGKMGQWEHELVIQRYEKPLLLQVCRLLRGFTHPGTYFEASDGELALYSVDKFAAEMDTLLDITLRSRLAEKLAAALYDCLFEAEEEALERQMQEGKDSDDSDYLTLLEESDHMAVASVHAFLQNLYFYASQNNEEYRRHLLVETLLIPRLVLPYLDRCVLHATILNSRAEAYSDMLEGDRIAEMALHNPQLVKGIAASLRTLIIASFRAPATQFVMSLLRRLNPTAQMLRARAFCEHNEYIFALLCLLNVNMGALDLARTNEVDEDGDSYSSYEGYHAHTLLKDLAAVYAQMEPAKQARVFKRVMFSGALPISRDTPSYAAVMSVLHGGAAGQLDYATSRHRNGDDDTGDKEEDDDAFSSRAEVKRMSADRVASFRGDHKHSGDSSADAKGDESKSSAGGESKRSAAPTPASASAQYRLLGDLPSLGGGRAGVGGGAAADRETRDKIDKDVKVALSLELPSDSNRGQAPRMMLGSSAGGKDSGHGKTPDNDGGIPKEFLCAINGHVMKEPVRAKTSGLVFEKATIEVWLATRGSVCPISNTALTKADLEEDNDLRSRIKRYHIQQTSLRSTAMPDDDLYDF